MKDNWREFGITIINNDIDINRIEEQLLLLEGAHEKEQQERLAKIEESQILLEEQINDWKEQRLIHTPVAGLVDLPQQTNAKHFVKAGTTICTIVPEEGEGPLLGRAILPARGSGKVERDMKVQIRLDAFPYEEYGVLHSTVAALSLVPQEQGFSAELYIPELITSYGIAIPLQQEMTGKAIIITKNKRLLDRVFEQLSNLIGQKQ